MKHLTLVILLALAPLSWGELVWHCKNELSVRVTESEVTALRFGLFILKYVQTKIGLSPWDTV